MVVASAVTPRRTGVRFPPAPLFTTISRPWLVNHSRLSHAVCSVRSMISLADYEKRFAAVELSTADPRTVKQLTVEARTAQRRIEADLTRLAMRAIDLEENGQGDPTEDVMRSLGDVSAREAQRSKQRAKTAREMPELGRAILTGDARPENVDEVGRAASRLEPAQLETLKDKGVEVAERAKSLPPETFGRWLGQTIKELTEDDGLDQLEQQRAGSSVRTWVNKRTGMYGIRGEWDPIRGAALVAALRSETASLSKQSADRDQPVVVNDNLRAQALHDLVVRGNVLPTASANSRINNSTQRDQSAKPRVSLTLIADYDTVLRGPRSDSISEFWDGSPLVPASLARLLCDAVVTPIVVNENGFPLNVGRRRRTATLEQRQALRVLYRTCAIDESTPFDVCEIHHINVAWEHGGATDLSNLVPISPRWHHLLHEGGYKAVMNADRSILITRPNGSIYRNIPPPRPTKVELGQLVS